MQLLRKLNLRVIALLVLFISCSINGVAAPDGKALFQSNCASCHNPIKDATGPALQGVESRVPSKEWLYKWVKNSPAVIASGDKYANEVYNKWNKTAMTAFTNLTNEDIDAIFTYVNAYVDPNAGPKDGGNQAAAGAQKDENAWWYVVITFTLLMLAVILWRVNSGLKRLANQKEGVPTPNEVPLYRNKVVIAIGTILFFIFAGYWITNGSINTGKMQNYQPDQPIFYSHKVHAGINQINCQYCHYSAEKGKMAMVPSTNTCMNCHKQISEYTGEEQHPLYTTDGKKVDGTAEIQKLYKAAGWDPVKKDYIRDEDGNIKATPIQWTRIHNLPDHVYFNHSQHVAVGQVQCQQCHGPIQDMDVVHQFAPLSMGWCVNCHRQTEVQFASNNYYSIYEKYHKELQDGSRDKVTVEEVGGLECQKCHY